MSWDLTFKRVLERYGGNGVNVFGGIEVGKGALRIDVLVRCERSILPLSGVGELGFLFSRFSEFNVLEFKSKGERIGLDTLYKLLAYAALYVAENRVSFPEEDVTAWLVASKTPVKLLRRYKGLGLLQRLEEGVYLVAGFPFRVFVVAIGELRVEPENYPFLIFSSGRTLREFLRRVIRERNQEYLSIGFLLYYDEVVRIMAEEQVALDPTSISIRKAVESIGISRVVEEIGLKKLIEEVGLKKVVDEIGLEKLVDEIGLEKLVDEIGLEKLVDEIGLEKLVGSSWTR
ncbi:MAG: hypothetical protein ACTSRF_10485 [Candidatus Freyarchaeota archaeon]